jgi:hypothetical protein
MTVVAATTEETGATSASKARIGRRPPVVLGPGHERSEVNDQHDRHAGHVNVHVSYVWLCRVGHFCRVAPGPDIVAGIPVGVLLQVVLVVVLGGIKCPGRDNLRYHVAAPTPGLVDQSFIFSAASRCASSW